LKGKSNEKAFTHVVKSLENSAKTNDQDVVTAIQLAKKLDASGKEDDLFKATEIYDNLSRHLTKKGQEIQAASLLGNRTPQGLIYAAQKKLRKSGIEVTPQVQKDIKNLVDNVKKQEPGSYEDGLARFKVMEYVEKKAPHGIASKTVQLWKAGLLSAPTTTGGNLAANTAEQIYKHGYKDPMAAGVDKIFSVFTGQRSKSFTYRGIGSGAKEGAVKGVKYFKTGYDPRNPLEKFDVHSIHYSDSIAGKAAEKYTQSIFKLMGSQDQPFYYASFRNSLADQAITEAKNAGLKGAQRSEFIKKYVTQPNKNALDLADKEARYDVFQNKTALGNLAHKVNDSPGGQFLIPFSQVPSSIATRIIERTPLGVAKEIIHQVKNRQFNQRAMSVAVADGSAGVAMIGAGAALAKAGELTLSYPTEKAERDLWELEGKQPNSVKVGNKWISLNYFQPLGSLFAAGARYQTAKSQGEDNTTAYSAAAAGAAKSLTEQSFLKGVSGALDALSDPQRSAEKFAENTSGSAIPNFIRSFARSKDPVNREQDGLGEAVKAGIPGVRETLPVKTNMYGDAVPRKTGPVSSYLNPLRPSDIPETTQLNGELRRLFNEDFATTAVKIQKNALGKDAPTLSRDQQLQLKKDVGQELKKAWTGIVADPRYQSLSDKDKQKKLNDAKGDITDAIKAKFSVESNLQKPEDLKLTTEARSVLGSGNGPDWLSKVAGGKININNGISSSSKDFLGKYANMDEKARNNLFNSDNGAEYKYLQSKFENDKANGELSKAQEAKAKYSLNQAKVGSKFSKETRDYYSLNKTELYDLLSNEPNGSALADQIVSYGDALEANGLGNNKFRDSKGNVVIAPKARGATSSGKGGGRGKTSVPSTSVSSNAISTAGSLNKKVAGSKVSSRGFASKVSKHGIQAYKKPAADRVAVVKKQLARSTS
jgi:hypothetical protein